MIESEKHLVNLGEREGTKRYLTVRERKKGLLVYLILEDVQGKRKYRQVTKIANSTLESLQRDNLVSRDADSLTFLASQLSTLSTKISRAVTESNNHNT